MAFVTGLVGGLFPYALGKELAMSDSALGWYLLAALIWASARIHWRLDFGSAIAVTYEIELRTACRIGTIFLLS